jgi:hypothetical protein
VSDNARSTIGYFVAGAGLLFFAATIWLIAKGTLTTANDKQILITLMVVSVLLVGLGMYVVVPKETHDFITDAGGVARDVVPRFGRRQEDQPAPAPLAVQPAPGQGAIVQPSSGPAVAVSPQGDVTVAKDSAPPVPQDPEVAIGAALPFTGRPTVPRGASSASRAHSTGPHPITGGARSRQQLYPPNEA